MYEHFTEQAKAVMRSAGAAAVLYHHNFINTEHILFGIFSADSGPAVETLRFLGFDRSSFPRAFRQAVAQGPVDVETKDPALAPRAIGTVRLALLEAREQGQDRVDVPHLLLALLRDQEGMAARILRGKGITYEVVRDMIQIANKQWEALVNPNPEHQNQNQALRPLENAPMYERFTDRARKVMQLANQEAQRYNHEYIGTEHILLGLVKEGSGVAANVLKNLTIDLRRIRSEVEKIVQRGPDMVTMGKLPQTPRAKKVIEYSIEEARNLNHNYVGTEHLLLGLLREEEGVAAQVLMNLGLKLEDVREGVLNLLGPNQHIPPFSVEKPKDPPLPLASVPTPAADKLSPQVAMHQAQIGVLEHQISTLERQLVNLRFLLAGVMGTGAGFFLYGQTGALLGLLGALLLTFVGRLIPAVLAGGVTGAFLGNTHLGGEYGVLAGALLAALLVVGVAEVGPTRPGRKPLWRRRGKKTPK